MQILRIHQIIPACLLCCVLCLSLQGQSSHVVTYGLEQGLGRTDVSCIFEDRRGSFWVGTAGAGVYQFNLGRFSRSAFDPVETGYQILKIDEDAGGVLHVLSEQGLFMYNGYEIRRIADPGVEDFTITGEGLWWITGNILCLRKGDTGAECEPVTATRILPDDGGVILLHGNSALHADADLKTSELTLIPGAGRITFCGQDENKALWFYSAAGDLIRLRNQSVLKFQLGEVHVNAIVPASMGTLMAGTASGLYAFQPADSSFVPLPVKARINALYYDRADRLWICTKDQGLLRYLGEQHQVYPVNGDPGKIVGGPTVTSSIIISPDGVATSLADATDQITLSGHEAGQLYVDAQRRTWALTHAALWMYRDTAWIAVDTTVSWQGGRNRIIGSDVQGLWVQKEHTLWRYGIEPVAFPAGVTFRGRAIAGEIPGDETVEMYAETPGRIWRLGSHSLGVIEELKYQQRRTFPFTVLSAVWDSSGILWLGTEASGIYRITEDEAPGQVQSPYPLRQADIVFLGRTREGLLAGTDRTVLNLVLDESGVRITRVDALSDDAGVTLRNLAHDNYALTDDGYLLVLNGHEVIEFNVSGQTSGRQAPRVHMSALRINGIDVYRTRHEASMSPFYQSLSPLQLSATENHLTLILSGNSIDGRQLIYQWRLNGRDDRWSEPSPESVIVLDGMPAGNYTLDIRVCDDAGYCSEETAAVHFVVQLPLWQRWWFIASVAIGGLLMFWFIYTAWLRRKLSTAVLEKKRLEAELNALALEQKTLQLQMNPHFIFNALQTVRSQIREDKLDTARDNLTHFAKLMRTMLDASRVETISLEEELDFLQAYVDVERMGHSERIEYNVRISEEVEPFAIGIPPMLIQPVVENAIKYGVQDGVTTIDLSISLEQDTLHVEVTDKGPGPGQSTSTHKSASLEIIRSRLEKQGRGGKIEVANAHGKGTKVLLIIPVIPG